MCTTAVNRRAPMSIHQGPVQKNHLRFSFYFFCREGESVYKFSCHIFSLDTPINGGVCLRPLDMQRWRGCCALYARTNCVHTLHSEGAGTRRALLFHSADGEAIDRSMMWVCFFLVLFLKRMRSYFIPQWFRSFFFVFCFFLFGKSRFAFFSAKWAA